MFIKVSFTQPREAVISAICSDSITPVTTFNFNATQVAIICRGHTYSTRFTIYTDPEFPRSCICKDVKVGVITRLDIIKWNGP